MGDVTVTTNKCLKSSSFAALLQQNLLSLPCQSQTGLLQHQPGLALTPQVNRPLPVCSWTSSQVDGESCRCIIVVVVVVVVVLLEDSTNLLLSEVLFCRSGPGDEPLRPGGPVHGEPHGHVPPADVQAHVRGPAGGAQRPGGAGAVRQSIQTTTHQTGLHTGEHRSARKHLENSCSHSAFT